MNSVDSNAALLQRVHYILLIKPSAAAIPHCAHRAAPRLHRAILSVIERMPLLFLCSTAACSYRNPLMDALLDVRDGASLFLSAFMPGLCNSFYISRLMEKGKLTPVSLGSQAQSLEIPSFGLRTFSQTGQLCTVELLLLHKFAHFTWLNKSHNTMFTEHFIRFTSKNLRAQVLHLL